MTYLPTSCYWYRVLSPPTSQTFVMSMISPLGWGTPRQVMEEILFFSWKQAFSLSVHHQRLVFFIRSVRGADE